MAKLYAAVSGWATKLTPKSDIARVQKRALSADWSEQLRQWARTIKAFPVIAVIEPNLFPAPIKMNMANGPGGGTLGLFGCGCAARALEPFAYTRASSSECCYPILD